MGKLHQIISWIPAFFVGFIGIAIGAAQIWPDVKSAIDPIEVFVMSHYLASAVFLSVTACLWYWALNRTNAIESTEKVAVGDSYNNSGYNFGHMGPVNIHTKPAQRTLNGDLKRELLSRLPKNRKINVGWIANNGEAEGFAMEIRSFLRESGYDLDPPSAIMAAWTVQPLELHDNENGVSLMVGTNA